MSSLVRGLVLNVVVLLLAVAAFAGFERYFFPSKDATPVERVDLTLTEIRRGAGYTHVVDLPEHWRSDTGEQPFQSRVVLIQDGRRNARAHRAHSEIADLGGGAYSHWGGKLLFSTLDNQPVESVKLEAVLEPTVDTSGEVAEKALSMFAMLLVLGWLLLLHWQLRDRDWGNWQPVIDTLWLVIVAVIWFGVVTVGADLLHPKQELRVVANESGHSFVAQLDRGRLPAGDTSASPRRSPYLVYENGTPLGPAHSAHSEIAQVGEGRFSHWHGRLFLSSSDGSSPLENGRRYQLGEPVPDYVAIVSLAPLAGAGLYALILLTAPLARRVSGKQYLMLVWIAATGLAVWGYSTLREERVVNDEMALHEGYAWVAPLHSGWHGSLDPINVFENDLPLGPGAQSYQQIIDDGAGRYTYWNNALTFSASDNVAPDANGRTYTAVLYPPAWYWLFVLAAFVVLIGVTFRHASWARQWMIYAVPCVVLFAAVYWLLAVVFPGYIVVVPDSYSYVNDTAMRPIAYPLMVDVVYLVSGGFDALLPIQLLFLVSALGLLAYLLGRLSRTPVAGLLILAGVATCYPLFLATGIVLSEPLFVTASILALAAMTAYVYTERRWIAVSTGVLIALLFLTRPVGYALLPLVLCLVALNFPRTGFKPLWMLAVPIVAMAIGAVASAVLESNRRGDSIGPQAILGHVAWAVEADENSRLPALSADLAEAVAPVLAERPAELDYPFEYQTYTTNEYNRLLWEKMRPVLEAHEPDLPGSSINRAAMIIALEAIQREPVAYLRHAFAHYVGLWVLQFDRPARVGPKLLTNYAATQDILDYVALEDLDSQRYAIDQSLPHGRMIYWDITNQWFTPMVREVLIAAVFAVSLIAPLMVLVLRFNISRAHCVLALMCLFLHGYYVTTALAQVAIARYIWPVEWLAWSILILGSALACRYLAHRWRLLRSAPGGDSLALPA